MFEWLPSKEKIQNENGTGIDEIISRQANAINESVVEPQKSKSLLGLFNEAKDKGAGSVGNFGTATDFFKNQGIEFNPFQLDENNEFEHK